MDVSYSTHINNAATQAKEALNKCQRIENNIEEKIDYQINKQNEYILTFLKSHNNSLGYKNRYKIKIYNELKNKYSIIALKAIFTYIVEHYMYINNNCLFHYNFFVDNHNLYMDIFHNNKEYLKNISNNFINSISNIFENIHNLVKNSFIDLEHTPLRVKLEKLQKIIPSFVDITLSVIEEEKKIKNAVSIVDNIIKLLYLNLVNIESVFLIKFVSKSNRNDSIKYICEYGELLEKTENIELLKKMDTENNNIKNTFNTDSNSLFKNINNINDKIQELFWHQVNEKQPSSLKKKLHFFAFIFIIYFLLFPLSKIVNKFINTSKNSKIMDDLLDMSTDNISDVTQTLNNKKNKKNNDNSTNNKLNTILEESETTEKNNNTSNVVLDINKNEEEIKKENDSKLFQKENINYIAKNIIDDYNNLNQSEIKKGSNIIDIEDRLRTILEETTTEH